MIDRTINKNYKLMILVIFLKFVTKLSLKIIKSKVHQP